MSDSAGMPGVMRSMLSGKDNMSVDVMRVLVGMFGIALVVFTAWSVERGGTFEPLGFVGACGGLLTSAATALRIKAPAEPGGG
jgi:hypothetical protein